MTAAIWSLSLLEQIFQLIPTFDMTGFALQSNGTTIAVSRVHAVHGIAHGIERFGEGRFVADGHGSGSVSMIAVRKGNDFVFFRTRQIAEILHGEFQRDFDGSRTIVREKHVGERRSDPFAKTRGKFFGGVMSKTGENDLLELPGLFGNSGSDARIGVAVKIDPPGRDGVDNFAAVGGVEEDAFGVGNANGRGSRAVRW